MSGVTRQRTIWPAVIPRTLLSTTTEFPSNTINHIGAPGRQGFGVGLCPALPTGFAAMAGATDIANDNYGNYQHSDGSVMVWVPAFYLRIGHVDNPTYPTYGVNSIDVRALAAYANEGAANADGYYLHRAFVNGGTNQAGVFVDKYQASNNAGIASSLKNGMPLVSASTTGNSPFSGLTGAPANIYAGAIDAAKTRGARFFPAPIYLYDALARLAMAHAQASTSAAWCAWYSASGVSAPRGNNNNALKDSDDAAVTYTAAGASGTPVLALTGSGTPFAKTTHNGQACGIADLNGNTWEIAPGMSSIASAKSITGISMVNPVRLTVPSHGFTTGQAARVYNIVGTTQLNDAMYRVTVIDANTVSLDGVNGTGMTAYSSGGSIQAGTIYALKSSVDIAAVTSGTTLATDHWGATGIAAQFDAVDLAYAATYPNNAYAQRYGNGANAVFGWATPTERARSMIGEPAAGGVSSAGSNLFGLDYYYQFMLDQMCVRVGGNWGNGGAAGVGARRLNSARGNSNDDVGFRSASYI